LKFLTMSHFLQIKEYEKNTNKIYHSLIKNPNGFETIKFWLHHFNEYVFNGNIGAPVHEKIASWCKSIGIWVAAKYPNSKFYADNITFISCDIYQKLPFLDNEFDYVFSRDKTDFFAKDKFQVFLFEIFRVLKPGGWLEERGIDFDLIIRLEDYLQMTGKTEFISSQIVKIPPGDNYLGEFICEAGSYYINLMKEFLAPYMGISFKEYDRLANEFENEIRAKKTMVKKKRVFAKKKVMCSHGEYRSIIY
ncbi:19621_t:CDS:2, partial [Gigaspora margarita]